MADKVILKQAKMVGWYNPLQLFDTGLKTAISTIVGEYADPRLGASDPTHGKFFDYSCQIRDVSDVKASPNPAAAQAAKLNDPEEGADGKQHDDFKPIDGKPRNSIWIDYASDVGDGWNSTYAVAYNLAQPVLKPDAATTTERGEILIFGGDGVYPTANSEEYKIRLVAPYRMAALAGGIRTAGLPPDGEIDLKKAPHIFVLPGNHDWYDSLTAFKKLFCSKVFNRRIFAGAWRTRQKRSYFTLKLPHGWWLLGVDLQLSHNIDLNQLEYFESIAEKMKPGDRIILCVPEPYWVKALKYDEFHVKKIEQKEESIQKLEDFFEQKAGAKIKAYIAGDLHHYRRFAHADGTQKITAGGGGAFLHPTHDFRYENLDLEKTKGFKMETAFPSYEESRKLDEGNLRFRHNNPKFGLVTLAVYPIIGWLIFNKLSGGGGFSFWSMFATPIQAVISQIIGQPLTILFIALLVAGVYAFTDSNSPRYKLWGSMAHSAAHLAAIFILGWLGYLMTLGLDNACPSNFETCPSIIWFVFVVLVVLPIGGYFIGSFIMGQYLYISLHKYGRHDNEAFSALKIEDYKNFLRLHIDEQGNLRIYPFKIEIVPKKWKQDEKGGAFLVPDYKDEKYGKAELIEKIAPVG